MINCLYYLIYHVPYTNVILPLSYAVQRKPAHRTNFEIFSLGEMFLNICMKTRIKEETSGLLTPRQDPR